MINPSTVVAYGLIILRFEPIRICRTLAIHDQMKRAISAHKRQTPLLPNGENGIVRKNRIYVMRADDVWQYTPHRR
jgi:hypothetical protein